MLSLRHDHQEENTKSLHFAVWLVIKSINCLSGNITLDPFTMEFLWCKKQGKREEKPLLMKKFARF